LLDLAKFYVTIKREGRFHDLHVVSEQGVKYPLFAEPAEHWDRQGQILLGRREFLVMDPDGYLLRFAQSLGERPQREAGES
jgi:hypothetical protein